MNQKAKINEIMAIIRGQDEFVDSIPVELWVENPAEVARRLNAMARQAGFDAHYTADEVTRFKD